MRRGAKKFIVKLTSEGLVNWFLAEVLDVVATYERYGEAGDALKKYFSSLEPYREWGDFAMNTWCRVRRRSKSSSSRTPFTDTSARAWLEYDYDEEARRSGF